eukprot:gnl/Dysnectes_brevis/2559_a3081_1862.p1 GENE.gnl/Dysnectes_brevis/2559_a3081_1862~~gnl/Dysnectes_brevis/2559_a3081_1862.p1  ORF type:complete len:292 (-),score=69.07 gnl/Dysnectes_brevis/2559_a3081_1862:34-909(-)
MKRVLKPITHALFAFGYILCLVFFLSRSMSAFPEYDLEHFQHSISSLGNPKANSREGTFWFGLAFAFIILLLVPFYRTFRDSTPSDLIVEYPLLRRRFGMLIDRTGGIHRWVKSSCLIAGLGIFMVVQFPEDSAPTRVYMADLPSMIPHSVGAGLAFLGNEFVLFLVGGAMKAAGRTKTSYLLIFGPLAVTIYTLLSQVVILPLIRGREVPEGGRKTDIMFLRWYTCEWAMLSVQLVCFLCGSFAPARDARLRRRLIRKASTPTGDEENGENGEGSTFGEALEEDHPELSL